MRRVFADTYYWIALLNDKDQGHATVQTVSQTLQGAQIVTTDEVLSEFLAHFSGHGPAVRQVTTHFVESVLSNPDVGCGSPPIPPNVSGGPGPLQSPARQGIQPDGLRLDGGYAAGGD